ncbi:hypothetical protein [Massilia sp. YIM B02443]|jgi:hypothetical protein|uniref:hypothetical protein n=1 Tax=Massilia sp. YIM B02443 TaxID=3050127 RepID=UPI0025B7045B|nr:hypothetical protein [Massilia sp. YIM B02443]MDN4039069.1 hypothetical protein [Massilia sp. YIM B02443]
MKAVLIVATLFIFVSMLMNGARRRGKLNEQANRAVTGLANSMRYFVYGLLVFVGIVCLAMAWHMLGPF